MLLFKSLGTAATVLGRVGESGRRDRASRLACLSLAGLSWPTTGLSLGSPRRWEGARTSAGGWGTPRVAASRSHIRKEQQGTLAAASPPLARLPMRRTAPARRALSRVRYLLAKLRGRAKAPRRLPPNAAAVDHLLLRARPWRQGFARSLRPAFPCLLCHFHINRAGPRERSAAGPWQR